MAEEFIPIEADEVEEFEPITKKRVSNPIKQGVAGLSDIITGIPAILGLAGSGIQAGYNTLTGDKGLKENFLTAMSDDGLDQALFDIGMSGRTGVNKLLGINEPISTEDQAARLAGGFLPLPGFALLSGASKLGNIAKGAANVLLPTVRTGKGGAAGFARRGAGQLGIGIGVDQGIRALQDDPNHPLIFSDEALAGVAASDTLDTPQFPQVGNYGSRGNLEEEFDPIVEEFVPMGEVSEDIIEGRPEGMAELIDIDRRVQKEQDWEDTKFWMMMIGAALGTGAGLKWARSGRTDTMAQQAIKTKDYIHEKFVDKASALEDSLRSIGMSKSARDKVVSNSHTDPIDIATNYENTGRLGQGYVIPKGMKSHSINKLESDRIALGEDGKLFDEAMIAQTQRATIQNTEEVADSALWRSAQNKIQGLDETIAAARKNKKVKSLMNKHSQNYEVLLDYQKFRGILTKADVDNFVKRATLNDVPGGRLAYAPLYAKTKKNYLRNLARNYLGINTKQGRIENVPNEFGARGINIANADELLDPTTAMKRYARSTIAHANTESFKGGVLDKLARVSRNEAGDASRLADDTSGEFLATGRDVQYIGKGTDFDDINQIHIDIETSSGFNQTGKFKSGTINDLRAIHGEDAIKTAHVGGELRVYHVPDKGLQAAVELNPMLGTKLQALSNWKNLFTQFTTGQYSLFAPISGLFSNQQIAINTAAREGIFAGIKSVGQSFKGTQKLLVESGSGAIAKYLSRRIARHVAEGNMPPAAMVKLEARLSRRFQDSVMNSVRTETGRTVTSVGNIGGGTMDDILDVVGPSSAKFYPSDELGLLKELWQTWNSAWHEGPAYGAMLKKIGKAAEEGLDPTDPQVIRSAVDLSKTVAGDMRRIGASGFAKSFNASVPFSSAMIQSWNSIGGAIKSNPIRFIGGASALIGVPTMSELAYNSSLSAASDPFVDEQGKSWTYDDYYWNGFTTQQRTDNFIYFVPGQPPWDAVLVPVSPEWGLFRATTMEAADALFNLSNTGDIGMVDQSKTNRSMFLGSLMRVLDIPLPPIAAAAASAMGMDVRLGLASEVKDDPDDPGRTTSILRAHPIGGGERVTRRSGKSRFAQGDLDRTTAAMLQDIFGAAGSMYINVHEAFASGVRGREGTATQGLSRGLDAFGQELKRQARYTQPLLGKAVRPNANDEIAKDLFVSRANLQRLGQQMNNGFIGGGIAYADGQLIEGQLTLPDDPINLELAASAKQINSSIAVLDDEIRTLKRALSTMGNATNLGSEREKHDKMDAKTLEIQALKAQQLAILHDFEDKISTHLTEKYERQIGKEIQIDLTSFVPRPDTTEGSTLKGLLNKPRTSR